MAEPIMAFLRHNERLRQVCIGCSGILHEQGMLNIAHETDAGIMNAPAGVYSVLIYEIAPAFTIDECRKAISARHLGERWGE